MTGGGRGRRDAPIAGMTNIRLTLPWAWRGAPLALLTPRLMLDFGMLHGRIRAGSGIPAFLMAVSLLLLAYAGTRVAVGQKAVAPVVPTVDAREGNKARVGPFSFVQTRDGAREWTLSARRGRTEDGQHAVLEDVAVEMVPSAGWPIALRADVGTLDLTTRNFSVKTARAPIAVAFGNGYTLETPALHWNDPSHLLIAERPIRVLGPAIRITGEALTVDARAQKAVVSGAVEAVLYP